MHVAHWQLVSVVLIAALSLAMLGGLVAAGTRGEPGVLHLADPWLHYRCYFNRHAGIAACYLSWSPWVYDGRGE